MKKIKTLIIVSILIVLPIIILRTCERSRLMRGLDAKSKKLDVLLDQEQHNGPDELGKALNYYLMETSFVLNNQGLLLGKYFSNRDRQIIFNNASKRLMRLKTLLLTNPSFFNMQQLPDLNNVVNLFYEKLGTASYNNKDQAVKNILKRWTDSGEMASLYMTKDELNQHRILAYEGRKMEDDKELQQVLAKNKEQLAKEPVIPGIENVQRLKQREVTRVTRLLIPFEQFDQYLGQKLNVLLKDGRQIIGKGAGSDQKSISIGFIIEGSSMNMKISREDVAKIEKVTTEKIMEMYDPISEREAALKPGFQELDYTPYPKSKGYVGFVTTDNKMVFVSTASGTLTCHSRENSEGFKPMATRIPENWPGDLQIHSQFRVYTGTNMHKESKIEYFSKLAWYKSFAEYPDAGNVSSIVNKKLDEKMNLVFELRLSKEVPGATAPIIIYQKDLILNEKTIRLMFYAQNIDSAINAIGNPKYGKGELPWEYELKIR
jgi:hypothetical protein